MPGARIGSLAAMEIREAAVVGLGTMGAGIAEVFARHGLAVVAVEADPGALSRGMATLDASLARSVSRGRLTQAEHADIFGRIRPAARLADTAGADLVIEVVPELLAIKQQVLVQLDQVCQPDAIIATNTSSLSVTAIAAGTTHPGRVVGMHFFNPAPVMRLVEVITTVLTSPAVGEAVTALARRLGKTPVRVTDRAGFVANALLLPYLNHAARLAGTGYASREDIDVAVAEGIGLPMGPLALLDLIGLDTSLAILEVLRDEFGGTRYVPAPLLRRLAEAGRTGRKSGAGFYDYPAKGSAPAPDSGYGNNADPPPPPGTVTLIDPGRSGDRAAELASLIAAAGINLISDPAHPSDLVIVAVGPEGGVLTAAMAARPGQRRGRAAPAQAGRAESGRDGACRAGVDPADVCPGAGRRAGTFGQAWPAPGPLTGPAGPARERSALSPSAGRGGDGSRRVRDTWRRGYGDDTGLRLPTRADPAALRRGTGAGA